MLKDQLTAPVIPVTLQTEAPEGAVKVTFVQPGDADFCFGNEDLGELICVVSGDPGKLKRNLVVSLGAKKPITEETLRCAGGLAARWLVKNKTGQAYLDLDSKPLEGRQSFVRACVEGLILGAVPAGSYKTTPASKPFSCCLVSQNPENYRQLVDQTRTVCGATLLARNWSREPANVINPLTLANRCQDLFEGTAVRVTIIGYDELVSMGAGGITGVGKGSQTPPCLIRLDYPGRQNGKSKPVALVGKAITFDSGGYSIKDSTNIQNMKYDKSGGVCVITAVAAAAALELNIPVTGVIAAAENMISANAYRPDDILTLLSGKTVEIVSTDAEGRLILADALTYAQKQAQPQSIIDLATLTGGIVVALGRYRAGLMSTDDRLSQRLLNSGDTTHERLWRLPLDDDFVEPVQGDEADLKNSAGRDGHAILGGMFLKQFIENDLPWAHLDIAGSASAIKDLPYCPKGATGFGVRLLIDYLASLEN